ncbi:MAG: hypothetical protein Q7S24_01450 [bacterium]|nr:hypothetical protein [bacterium]
MSLAKKINLRAGEDIIEVVHQFGLVFWWRYLLGFACLFVTAFFITWFLAQNVLGYIALGLGTFIGLYIIIHTWFFQSHSLLVITTERVVDINRAGWFEELISSAMFGNIKDIYLHRKGILASMFGYAKVVIETKSERSLLELEAVRHPEKIVALILEAVEKAETALSLGSKKAIYEKFIQLIPSLAEADLCEVEDLIGAQLSRLDEVEAVEIDIDLAEAEVV